MKIEFTFIYDLNELLVKPVNISKVCESEKKNVCYFLRLEMKKKKQMST